MNSPLHPLNVRACAGVDRASPGGCHVNAPLNPIAMKASRRMADRARANRAASFGACRRPKPAHFATRARCVHDSGLSALIGPTRAKRADEFGGPVRAGTRQFGSDAVASFEAA